MAYLQSCACPSNQVLVRDDICMGEDSVEFDFEELGHQFTGAIPPQPFEPLDTLVLVPELLDGLIHNRSRTLDRVVVLIVGLWLELVWIHCI